MSTTLPIHHLLIKPETEEHHKFICSSVLTYIKAECRLREDTAPNPLLAVRTFDFKREALNTNRNVVISPFSAYMALGMTANGASGRTRSQMAQVLGVSGDDFPGFNISIVSLASVALNLIALIVANLTGHSDHLNTTDCLVFCLAGFALIRIEKLQRQQAAVIQILKNGNAKKKQQS